MAPDPRLFDIRTFTATECLINGKRAIALTARGSNWKPQTVNLIVQQRLSGSAIFPAAYEYVDTPISRIFDVQSPRHAALRIVAGPGVSVHVESWPTNNPSDWLLEVVRVQDPDVVPRQATTIQSDLYTSPVEINPPPVKLEEMRLYPMEYFIVESNPGELVVTHPYSTYTLTLDYASTSKSSTDGSDSKARFCYQVSARGQNLLAEWTGYNLGEQPTFMIAKTPNVKATVKDGPPKTTFRVYNTRQYDIPFRIYEAPDIATIPPQGADISDIESRPEFRNVTAKTEFQPNYIDPEALVVYTAFRTVLGFVPIVSQTIDVAEFALATAMGMDFIGRKLTKDEKYILGLGIIMDFGPMSGSALLRVFRRKIISATAVKAAIATGKITTKEQALLKEAEKLIQKGGKATAEQIEAAVNVSKQMPEAHVTIESILNADATGFTHSELQQGYQAYKQRMAKAKETPLSPAEWAQSNNSGRYSDILVQMLGQTFRKGANAGPSVPPVTFNLLEVMRPLGYSEELAKEHLAFTLANNPGAAKKLQRLMADLASTDEAVALLARTQMVQGRFNNVKGVIGEIFALPMMQNILKEKHPDALLFTNLTMRRANGAEKEFADNIIAVRKGNDIEIRLVFEVKSGDKGGAEATQQIFDWIEMRLEDGDQIIIPAGSKYYDAAGQEMTLAKEIRVKYQEPPSVEEAKAGVGMVRGLAKAERQILAAEGTSQLGLNNRDQTYVGIGRMALPVTSEQIDYLGAQLVMALGKGKP